MVCLDCILDAMLSKMIGEIAENTVYAQCVLVFDSEFSVIRVLGFGFRRLGNTKTLALRRYWPCIL